MLQEQSATAEDRFELARMYLADGNWIQASTQFRNLVTSHGTEPRYLIAYIAALMDHGETTNAETYLDRLERISPNHIDTVNLRAQMLVTKNQPEKAFELLKAFVDKPGAQPPERNVRVRLVAAELEQLARWLTNPAQKPMVERFTRQAEVLYQAYIAPESGQKWEMVAFLGRQGRVDEALGLLDRTWDGYSPVGALPRYVRRSCCTTTRSDRSKCTRIDRILQKAMRRFDRPIPLLMITADLYSKQARYVDVENLYREVLAEEQQRLQCHEQPRHVAGPPRHQTR